MTSENDLSVRQVSKLETRNSLLEVSLELFVENGFDTTGTNEIAQKAGVAVGTIYLHFGDKEGLLSAILENLADSIYVRVQEVYEKHPTARPEDLARMHIEQLIQYAEENQKIAPFVLGYVQSNHPVGVKIVDFIVSQIEENIRQGQEAGIYRSDIQPLLAARAEANMNLGLISWWVNHQENVGRDEIIDTLVKFRLSGLHARSK